MIEVRRITILVAVDREKEDRPEKWDWRDLTDTWAVPSGDSELVNAYPTMDAFYDALDEGADPATPTTA